MRDGEYVWSQPPIAYVDIRFVPTLPKTSDKVMEAIHNILPSRLLNDVTFNRNVVEGHYGNPITFFETRINDKEIVRVLVENISSNLSSWIRMN